MQVKLGLKPTCASKAAGAARTACVSAWVAAQQAKLCKPGALLGCGCATVAPTARQACINTWVVKNYALYMATAPAPKPAPSPSPAAKKVGADRGGLPACRP
jgi:hypothetical protein